MRFVGKISGGIGSYLASRRVARRFGPSVIRLCFTDTLIEDQDAYRFLIASSATVFQIEVPSGRLPEIEDFPKWHDREKYKAFVIELSRETTAWMPGLSWVNNGLDPWDIYRRERILGNTRFDPCSKHLKRLVSLRWLKQNCDPREDVVVVGLDHEEKERFYGDMRRRTPGFKARMRQEGWRAIAPLCDPPYLGQDRRLALLEQESLWQPRLNALGFAHNNCGGHCCKGGLGHWLLLLKHFPERFWFCAEQEEELLQTVTNRDLTMLRDRRGGVTRPLSLRALAARHAEPEEVSDMGGCGCYSGLGIAAE